MAAFKDEDALCRPSPFAKAEAVPIVTPSQPGDRPNIESYSRHASPSTGLPGYSTGTQQLHKGAFSKESSRIRHPPPEAGQFTERRTKMAADQHKAFWSQPSMMCEDDSMPDQNELIAKQMDYLAE